MAPVLDESPLDQGAWHRVLSAPVLTTPAIWPRTASAKRVDSAKKGSFRKSGRIAEIDVIDDFDAGCHALLACNNGGWHLYTFPVHTFT